MTGKRALVLGGGGVAGIAWETGILIGIADESPAAAAALLDSDVLLGTSAGSAVVAQLSSGLDLAELFARQVSETSAELDPGVEIEAITELFLAALSDPDTTVVQKRQRIGAVALASDTVAEPLRRNVIAQRLPSHVWPDRVLRLTAIDAATGELVVLDRDSGVELVDAVAASCAVPGAWPPVTIGDRRYMDGGVGSTINLDVADDCDAAVVLVPAGESAPSAVRRRTGRGDQRVSRCGAGCVRRRRVAGGIRAQRTRSRAAGPPPRGPDGLRASGRRRPSRRSSASGDASLVQAGQRVGSQLAAGLDNVCRAVEVRTAASWSAAPRSAGRTDHRQCVAGQRGLGNVDGAVHHLETAEPGEVRTPGRPPEASASSASSALDVPNRSSTARAVGESSSADVLLSIRFSHSVVGRGPGAGSPPPASLPDRLTAIVRSAFDSRDRRHRQRVEDAAVGQQPPVQRRAAR